MQKKEDNTLSFNVHFSDSQWMLLVCNIPCVALKKNERLNLDSALAWIYVQSGAVIHSYVSDDGERQVHSFIETQEMRWVSKKAEIHALQDSRVYGITEREGADLCRQNPFWTDVLLDLSQKEIMFFEERLRDAFQLSLQERFMKFHEAHLNMNIPQYLIANYLGASPVSISRLRQKKTSTT